MAKAQNNKTKQQDKDDQDLARTEKFLREVDEDMRKERMEKLWNNYGGLLIAVCVAIVIGTGIKVYWQDRTNNYNMAQTDALYQWLGQESKEQRLNATLENLVAPTTSQEWLTLFYAGNDALEQQRFEDATVIYGMLRDNRQYGRDLRWLADLMELRVLMQTTTENFEPLQARLEDLAAQDENPWRALAYFDAAVWAAEKQQDYNAALELLAESSRYSEGSTALMSMISDLTHLYTVKKGQTPPAETQPSDVAPAASSDEGESAK